jgi:hypothetical protein
LQDGSGVRNSMRFGFGRRRVHGNADGRTAVPAGVGQVHRCFEARHQALVGVGGGVGECAQGLAVFQDAADGVEGFLGNAGVLVAGEQGVVVLPDADVGVHAGAVVFKKRFGHEGHGVAGFVGHVFQHIFEPHELVGHLQQRLEAHVDFGLAGSGHLVMLALDVDAEAFQGQQHIGSADPGTCPLAARESSLLCGAVCIPGWALRSGPCSRCLPRNRWHKMRHCAGCRSEYRRK